MTSTTHPVSPEDVMALLDGELSTTEAHTVSTHLAHCGDCTALVEQLQHTSQSLASWAVPTAPDAIKLPTRPENIPRSRKPWLLVTGGALASVIVLLVLFATIPSHREAHLEAGKNQYIEPLPLPKSDKSKTVDSLVQLSKGVVSSEPSVSMQDKVNANEAKARSRTFAPLIARTAALTLLVKNLDSTRTAFDQILERHHGYSAQLTVSNPEVAQRIFEASLRVPAGELLATLTDLKALGRVANESQSGEEVTQQHADLAARLKNSRETEVRLQAILQQHTGKVSDILEVEEHIAQVRGEIESMEAEQQALDHRIDFATINLTIQEEYKATLNPPAASVSTRIHNAFAAGYHNAAETLLGIVLFLEEYGPTLLIWLAILALPGLLLLRCFRRLQ